MLPYGYSVSLVLSMIPPVWKKVINPLAEAANKSEKMQEEVRKQLEKWILGTLMCVSIVLTYVTFFIFGFNKYEAN